jgi:hypothetical protein
MAPEILLSIGRVNLTVKTLGALNYPESSASQRHDHSGVKLRIYNMRHEINERHLLWQVQSSK